LFPLSSFASTIGQAIDACSFKGFGDATSGGPFSNGSAPQGVNFGDTISALMT
jgi:hypothetical protein